MELSEKIQLISRWRRGDQRAPHKPLMLLYALSEYKQGHQRLFRFEDEVDQQVRDLLVQYGPTRKAYHPEYPFWRLANEKSPSGSSSTVKSAFQGRVTLTPRNLS